MKRINVADLAANATAYELDDGRVYRIHMNLITPVQNLATADYVEVETKGYQIDKSGAFMVDDNGEPITLPPQRARIPLANVRAGLDTVKPGWVAQNLPEDEAAQAEALKGARKLKKLPSEGEAGDKVLVDDVLYGWGDGLYDQVRRQRLADLAPMADAPAALDDATIQDLIP